MHMAIHDNMQEQMYISYYTILISGNTSNYFYGTHRVTFCLEKLQLIPLPSIIKVATLSKFITTSI